ncbi:uncharacterized protein LOC106642789 isoform X3 [Copidosoma floridanum]|uniref:uncharacterized protein LOC106642789 isoform X3 n=1 Tax=Copidosoma floridanum TaxID=29053 RepID=UPI0006C960E2|nr:uncharacterized protein LOC106642789 isoform X3 [Copidosoma floridanum]
MAEQTERNQLPPGWECRYDGKSGRAYFINHFNRSTTWEDPRVRYWQYAQYLQSQNSTTPSSGITDHPSDSIPLQTSGNSTTGHIVYSGAHRAPQVYPTPSYCNPQPAFLPPNWQDLKTPLSTTRSVSGLTNRLGDMTIGSPTPIRNFESSLMQNNDVELQVAKINAIFPTVSDTHIRLLLKKYLKNVFPTVDEYILLDNLEQCENNVQKATDKLLELGYEKRCPTAPSRSSIKKKEVDEEEKIQITPPAPTPPPRMKSMEEKNKMKLHLMDKFKEVPEKVILLAMDSVDYDEERAAHILDIMVAEEAIKPLRTSSSQSSTKSEDRKDSPPVTEALKLSYSPIKRIAKESDIEKSKRPKTKSDVPKVSRGTSTAEDNDHKSIYLTRPTGPNADLPKGANNELLLPDYAPWSGPDPSLLVKNIYGKILTAGRNPSLVRGSLNLAKGPNLELRKGPLRGLAQGSIYSQRNITAIECRGK